MEETDQQDTRAGIDHATKGTSQEAIKAAWPLLCIWTGPAWRRLAISSEPTPDRHGACSFTNKSRSWSAVWNRNMEETDQQDTRAGIDHATKGTSQEEIKVECPLLSYKTSPDDHCYVVQGSFVFLRSAEYTTPEPYGENQHAVNPARACGRWLIRRSTID